MENNSTSQTIAAQEATLVRSFLSNTFSWMFLALAISGFMAYTVGSSESLVQYLLNFETGKLTTLGWIAMFLPLGFVLLMSFAFNKLSYPLMVAFFLAYAIVTGISLSFIFLVYSLGSIYLTFGITAVTFGVMAIAGYTTKTDLTKMGSILMMGLVGIIIASLINLFMQSSKMDYIISFFGVIIFTGLTAYDMQKLKRIGAGAEHGTAHTAKLSSNGGINPVPGFS